MNKTVDQKLFNDLMTLYITTDAMFQQLFEKVVDKGIDIILKEPCPEKFIKSEEQVISIINRLNDFTDKNKRKQNSIKKCSCGDVNCVFYKERMGIVGPFPKHPVRPLIEDIKEDDVSNIPLPSPCPENQIIKEGEISPWPYTKEEAKQIRHDVMIGVKEVSENGEIVEVKKIPWYKIWMENLRKK